MPDLYVRRRRLATIIAATSALALTGWLTFGKFPETFSHPAIIPGTDALTITHRAGRLRDNEIVNYLATLDPATLELRSRTWFYDQSLVAVRTRDDLLGFFGQGYRSLMRDGKLERLDQDWPVEAVAREEDTLWLFGVRERAIVSRRMQRGALQAVETVAEAGAEVERMVATFAPEGGVAVVWKEKDRPDLKAARRRGGRFERLPDFATGDAPHWTALAAGPRLLAIWFDRKDQAWSTLALQVRCCGDCGRPTPPPQWTFKDRFVLLARRVTGIGAAIDGDRVRLVVTRVTAIQGANVPLATLEPESGAALAPIRVEAGWVRYVGLLLPSVLLFFSFSLIYLGFVLLRDRRRALLGGRFPVPLYADAMQRIMAFIIDQMIISPVLYAIVDMMGLAPESPDTLPTDPRVLTAIAIGYALNVVYFFAQEAWNGQTIGKRIIGIRVVRLGSDRLTLGRALARNLLRCFDAYNIAMIVGLGLILFTRRRQRIGDLVAGTVVVQAHREPEREPQRAQPSEHESPAPRR